MKTKRPHRVGSPTIECQHTNVNGPLIEHRHSYVMGTIDWMPTRDHWLWLSVAKNTKSVRRHDNQDGCLCRFRLSHYFVGSIMYIYSIQYAIQTSRYEHKILLLWWEISSYKLLVTRISPIVTYVYIKNRDHFSGSFGFAAVSLLTIKYRSWRELRRKEH